MKREISIKKEVEIKYLKVQAGARYWEDATVNGVEDADGDLIPMRDGEYWCPLIDIDKGVIIGWPKGTTAEVHYKVCDDGIYSLLDESQNELLKKDGYVPAIMSPKENGYGDYIIMDIDENGLISDWKIDIDDFVEEEY